MAKVLVTGVTGNLGRYLIPQLMKQGHEIITLARPSNEMSAKERIEKLFGKEKIQVIEGDLQNLPDDYDESIDKVYHLAGFLNLGFKREKQIWDINYHGTVNMLKFAEEHKVSEFYLVSTAFAERGRNPYEKSKKAAEEEAKKGIV